MQTTCDYFSLGEGVIAGVDDAQPAADVDQLVEPGCGAVENGKGAEVHARQGGTDRGGGQGRHRGRHEDAQLPWENLLK
jgi:hypothetical protein